MTIEYVTKKHYSAFKKAFCEYYEELGCEDEPHHLFDEYVLPDLEDELFCVGVALLNGELCGFIVFQVDAQGNEWCFREGDGDIREVFVLPSYRNEGVGKALVEFAQTELSALGVKSAFVLPTEESESFFASCGFADCGDYCAELDNKVLEKTL